MLAMRRRELLGPDCTLRSSFRARNGNISCDGYQFAANTHHHHHHRHRQEFVIKALFNVM